MGDKNDSQYKPYSELKFNIINLWIKKYFSLTSLIQNSIKELYKTYFDSNKQICSIIYRGNDKARETTISPYIFFIDKAEEILRDHPNIVFHIQTDETEFKNLFLSRFPNNSFYCEAIPSINKSMTSVTDTIPLNKRINFAINFLSLIYIASQSHTIITHSGNVGLWAILFRGNANNVYQILNNKFI